ncbi:hypothetical protein AAG906_030495 [Vitis piasezkii]
MGIHNAWAIFLVFFQSICSRCDKAIPSTNIDLHYAHCSRNLERCKHCGDMVPKKHAEEHYLNTHAAVSCSLCSETMEREILAVHKGENCPQRIVTCEFCEFPLPAIDLSEHQEVCGNRTELCHLCRRYVRLRERNGHEAMCNGAPDNSVGVQDNGVGVSDHTVSSSRSRRFSSQDRAAFLPNAVYLKLFAACFKIQASLSPYQNPSSIYLCL